jgi:hypothetical protein
MEKVVGIDVPLLGILNGRDCIYIDNVIQDNYDNLEFKGEINGYLADKIKEKKWIPYSLVFHKVIAYFSCELDTYENIDAYGYLDYTDFNVVENSQWLTNFPIRKDFDKSLYKHYQLFTYNIVYNIIAVSFDFDIDVNFHGKKF